MGPKTTPKPQRWETFSKRQALAVEVFQQHAAGATMLLLPGNNAVPKTKKGFKSPKW